MPHRLNNPQALKARRLYESGQSLRQIAGRMDCSQEAVKNAVLAVGGTIRTRDEGALLRHGVTLEYGGKRMSISQWARELGRPRTTLISRYQSGWAVKQILGGQG